MVAEERVLKNTLVAAMAWLALAGCTHGSKRLAEIPPGYEAYCAEQSGPGLRLPIITRVSPSEGTALGGLGVTVTGDGFAEGTQVFLGGSPCSDIKVLDPNHLTCTTGGRTAGRVDALAMNPDRKCGSLENAFIYMPNVSIAPRFKTVASGNKIEFQPSGGKPPYSFSVVTGGGSIDGATGVYTAPFTPGTAVVRVTDAQSTLAEAVVTINARMTIEAVPSTNKTGSGSYVFNVKGGAPPINYSIVQGEGALEPPSTGDDGATNPSASAVIRFEDAVGNTAEITVGILRPNPLVAIPQEATIVPGDRLKIQAAGGTPPYRYSIQTGRGTISQNGLYVAPGDTSSEVARVTDSSGSAVDISISVSNEAGASRRVAAGYAHTCAIAGGYLKCWGDNKHGQLGNGTLTRKVRPVEVNGLGRGVLAVTAGQSHTCALIVGGQVWCWGDNRYGQLGNGSKVNSNIPVPVFGLTAGVQSVVAGEYHTCAIAKGGGAYCWGSNRRGQLGNNSHAQSLIPVPVRGLSKGVRAISAGAAHACAIVGEEVRCWGYNYSGQLGDGTVADRAVPTPVVGLTSGAKALALGGYHSCALIGDGIKCWGNGGVGQLGNGSDQNALVPGDVPSLTSGIRAVSAGFYHTCVILSEGGTVRCWGFNHDGQLGAGIESNHERLPHEVPLVEAATMVACGSNHTCAWVGNGLQCWGSNSEGQFGNRTVTGSKSPAPPVSLQ